MCKVAISIRIDFLSYRLILDDIIHPSGSPEADVFHPGVGSLLRAA